MANTTTINATVKAPTERELLNKLLTLSEVKNDEALVAFVNKKLGQLDKKNEANKAIKNADAVIMNAILNVLRNAAEPMRVTEICQIGGFIDEGISSNKVTSMVTKLVSMGKLNKTTEKRTSKFAIVAEATDLEVK